MPITATLAPIILLHKLQRGYISAKKTTFFWPSQLELCWEKSYGTEKVLKMTNMKIKAVLTYLKCGNKPPIPLGLFCVLIQCWTFFDLSS